MAWGAELAEALQSGLNRLPEVIAGWLPQLLGGLAVLLAGVLLAAVLRLGAARAVRALDWLLRLLPGTARQRTRGSRVPALVGDAVFWITIAAAVAVAARVLGLTLVSAWLDAALGYLPVIVLAIAIMVAGVVIGHFAREAVSHASAGYGPEYRRLLGTATQVVILAAAGVIALDLLGLDITFLVIVAGLLGGAVAGGLALAFGFGAQTLVSNVLGLRALDPSIRAGDRIRIGEIEGAVVEVGRQTLVLDTDAGRVTVPGKHFGESPCTRLMPESDDD